MNNKVETLSNRIAKRLKETLPGFEVQRRMSPKPRKYLDEHFPFKQAAILILLFPVNGAIHIAFIKRSIYDGPHSGQISFPGGVFEKEDVNLSNTALRESMEEIGIIPKEIHLLGNLSKLQIPVSLFEVMPFVGYSKSTPRFVIDPKEVQEIILIPLFKLADKNIISNELRVLGNTKYSIPFYKYNGHKIWGATAMILSEFLQIMEELEPNDCSHQYSDNDCTDT